MIKLITNIVKFLFCRSLTLSFLIILFIPIFFIDIKNKTSDVEKRDLSAFPQFIIDRHLNASLFHDLDRYINDRFGFRSKYISLDNHIKYSLLSDSGNDRAIIGKSGWLYYQLDGNIEDYFKTNLLSENILDEFAYQIKKRSDWCEENNIDFVYLIAPNKHNIYPENYPIKRPTGITRSSQITDRLKKANINFIYPKDLLINKKEIVDHPIYYLTDTHWNKLGAYLVFEIFSQGMRNLFKEIDFPDIEFKYTVDTTSGMGDITNMLGFQEYKIDYQISFFPYNSSWDDHYAYIKNEGCNGIITSAKNADLPKAIIFRDSFFTSLQPFTSTLFSTAEYKWKKFDENDKAFILEMKPDIVIFEVVERYMMNIVNSDFK